MRSRRTTQQEMAEVARRRLDLLSAELAAIREAGLPPNEAAAEAAAPAGTAPDATAPDGTAPDGDAPDGDGEGQHHGHGGPGRHARRPLGRAERTGGWLRDRLPPTLQGRVGLGLGHLAVVVVLVVAALGVTAWWALRADRGGTPVPAASRAVGGTVAPAGGAAAPGEPLIEPVVTPEEPVSETPAPLLVVDVAGKVRRPGIVTLEQGARVVDALEAAGGARRGVDLTALNLARLLTDGEQLLVGVTPPPGVAPPAAAAPTAGVEGPPSLVNINTATEAQLDDLPGVGPVTASAIVQWRTENGPFSAVDELIEVSGIGEATLAEMAPFVTL
jgi:competence protein ComEA